MLLTFKLDHSPIAALATAYGVLLLVAVFWLCLLPKSRRFEVRGFQDLLDELELVGAESISSPGLANPQIARRNRFEKASQIQETLRRMSSNAIIFGCLACLDQHGPSPEEVELARRIRRSSARFKLCVSVFHLAPPSIGVILASEAFLRFAENFYWTLAGRLQDIYSLRHSRQSAALAAACNLPPCAFTEENNRF